MRIAFLSCRAGKKCHPIIQVEFPVGQVTFHFHLGKGAGKLSANLLGKGKFESCLGASESSSFFVKEGHDVTLHHCFINCSLRPFLATWSFFYLVWLHLMKKVWCTLLGCWIHHAHHSGLWQVKSGHPGKGNCQLSQDNFAPDFWPTRLSHVDVI